MEKQVVLLHPTISWETLAQGLSSTWRSSTNALKTGDCENSGKDYFAICQNGKKL